ncbi:zinc finger protein 174-like isoform X3 [Gadus chalcogrammus]|uniref:zinc finger protein 174-like isoform X3 n=1 Tax=Gadus chalcogrammus TaxID=1042646 RepID=UPI0024C4202A|nr:zinc finger protein 174-like isoform X3 [Gadus chalcogrammus]
MNRWTRPQPVKTAAIPCLAAEHWWIAEACAARFQAFQAVINPNTRRSNRLRESGVTARLQPSPVYWKVNKAMENCGHFHTQLLSIMEVLANTAVLEICKLVDDGFTHLRLEVSRTQRENLELKSKLRLMEVGAPVPPLGSCSERGHSAEPLLGGRDGETDMLEEKPLVVIKLEEELTGCIMGECHRELPASSMVDEQPSLAPKEEWCAPLVFMSGGDRQEEQAWSGSGLVGGPSPRGGAGFLLGGVSRPAPGRGVARGDSLSKGSRSIEMGAPRRLSSRLLTPRPTGGAKDGIGSSPLSLQNKNPSSSSSSSVKRTPRTSLSEGNGRDPAHPWVFSCPMCRKDFSTSKGLTVHQRLSHGPGGSQRAVRPFSCSVCGKHFLRSSSLKPHMGIHVGEPYACTQCGRRYSSRGNLGRHQALCNAASST